MTSDDPVYFLLVDDREENLRSLEALLRRDRVILLKAHSGPEALEMLLQYDVALALLDVQMPGMDGFELAELMRGAERTKAVPIIFLTAGSADRQRRFRGYEAGAVDFLHKPLEPDILRSKAEVFFELFLQRREISRQRDELEAYAAALKEADRRKDEFLAVLAHELRNPLAPIRYALDIMRLTPDKTSFEDLRAMMERQVVHLVRLIDDLLDVSRVSRGKIDLRKETIALQSAVQAAIETCRPAMEAGEHTLTVDIPEESIWVNADLTRLAQVVSNLLNNAAKYTPKGGLIRLKVVRDGDQAVIEVSDNGLGIPPEMRTQIFDLFIQVENGLGKSRGGLGIGLALARQLVDMHQGTISVDVGEEGRGSTFRVRLPVLAASVGAEPEFADELPNGSPLQVLVVDDNVSSAETTSQILRLIGHRVSVAFGGDEAVRAAREIRPDVILLDLGMPGVSGYDVCRELRRDPEFSGTLLIAQTGWGQDADRQRTKEAGFDHHLTKPIDLEVLNGLLSEIAERAQA